MRPLFVLFILSVLPPSPTHAEPPALSIADIDSLRCPPRERLIAHITGRLRFDSQLEQHQVRQILAACARLEALQQELAILKRQQANLMLIHRLNLEKQNRSEISDLQVLQSEQNLLNKQMAIAGHTYQIRETILDLTRLANIHIRFQH